MSRTGVITCPFFSPKNVIAMCNSYGNIPNLKKTNKTDTIVDVLNNNMYTVMERFVDCVDIAYNLSMDYIPVVYIPEEDFELGLEPQDFMEKLEIAEEYFIEEQQFLICQRIVDIRSRI